MINTRKAAPVPHEVLMLALVLVTAFGTATLSAVAGLGGGGVLLPVFVAVFGARNAVAVLTVTQLASNGSRVWFNRHVIDRRPVRIFAAGAIPALTRVIGAFLLVMVVWRRIRPGIARLGDRGFAAVGAASGFGGRAVVERLLQPHHQNKQHCDCQEEAEDHLEDDVQVVRHSTHPPTRRVSGHRSRSRVIVKTYR
jgi:hypothetical protein